MNTPWLTALLALAAGTPLVGQMPAHATVLNPTTAMAEVLVLQDGDTVHALGRSAFSVLHARSRDGGRTWPVREAPIGPYTAGQGFAAAIGMPGTVMALAYDGNTGPTFWRSADEGSTWSPGITLSSVVSPLGAGATALLVEGLEVTAVWVRNGGEVACRRSLDDGVSWLPEQRLSVPGTSNAGLSCHRNGNVLDVIWAQDNSTVHQRSTDGGTTWLPAPQVVCGNGLVNAVSNGTDLLVALTTGIFWRSTNGGASWTSFTIPGHGYPMSMSHEGSRIAVTSLVAYPAGSLTYAISVSSNGGLTWSPTLLLPSPVYVVPRTLVALGNTYVAFPGLALDIVTSRDGGTSWQLLGGPANFLCAGPRRNVNIVLAGFPQARFHAYVGLGSSVLGSATMGTGGIAPRLWSDGLPFQGATTTLRLDQAVGGSVAALGVSFATPAPVPFGSATLWPTVAPIVLAFATGGGGQPGAGSFAQPLAIPVASALVGTSFTSQALVVDGAAADGFTVSNALETWLR